MVRAMGMETSFEFTLACWVVRRRVTPQSKVARNAARLRLIAASLVGGAGARCEPAALAEPSSVSARALWIAEAYGLCSPSTANAAGDGTRCPFVRDPRSQRQSGRARICHQAQSMSMISSSAAVDMSRHRWTPLAERRQRLGPIGRLHCFVIVADEQFGRRSAQGHSKQDIAGIDG